MAELDHKYLSELVLRAQEGDSDSFAELYVATYQYQYRFSYRYLQDQFLAQDALQETYILALKNLTTLRDPQVFVSWLNQINMRICFRIHRQQKRQDLQLLRYDLLHRQDANDPEDLAVKQDFEDRLVRQILKLPFSESQAIILRYFRNMKLDEVADMMDISVSSVKRYLESAKKKLQRHLV